MPKSRKFPHRSSKLRDKKRKARKSRKSRKSRKLRKYLLKNGGYGFFKPAIASSTFLGSKLLNNRDTNNLSLTPSSSSGRGPPRIPTNNQFPLVYSPDPDRNERDDPMWIPLNERQQDDSFSEVASDMAGVKSPIDKFMKIDDILSKSESSKKMFDDYDRMERERRKKEMNYDPLWINYEHNE